jgi:hypothetical protein
MEALKEKEFFQVGRRGEKKMKVWFFWDLSTTMKNSSAESVSSSSNREHVENGTQLQLHCDEADHRLLFVSTRFQS